jgi:hypothetical protein
MTMLSRYDAANYIGVPAISFDKLVSQGRMPPAVNGRWNLTAIDAAFDALPIPAGKSEWAYLVGVAGVYFAGYGDYVKIGVSRSIGGRMRELSTSSPERLKIHGIVRGGTIKLERELHRRFKQYRRNGEWFLFAPPIREYITAVERAGNG